MFMIEFCSLRAQVCSLAHNLCVWIRDHLGLFGAEFALYENNFRRLRAQFAQLGKFVIEFCSLRAQVGSLAHNLRVLNESIHVAIS